MAVSLVSATKTYTGGSVDTKPTENVPPGSIFYEFTDGEPPTVRTYLFDGTAWGQLVRSTEAIGE